MKTNTKLLNIIVDFGKATRLTLGGGGGGAETKNRPFGLLCRNEKPETNFHVAYIVEIGKAASLTLGGFGDDLEFGFRPIQFNSKNHMIEFGIATQLTLGGNGSIWEYMRPNAAVRQ